MKKRVNAEYNNIVCSCGEKALYILAYCDPILGLCYDHMPKWNNKPKDKLKIKVIKRQKKFDLKDHYSWKKKIETTLYQEKDGCYFCGDNNAPVRKWIMPYPTYQDNPTGVIHPGIPVDPVNIRVCECCWNYDCPCTKCEQERFKQKEEEEMLTNLRRRMFNGDVT